MVQHYFASAWLLADGVQRDLFTRKVDTNLYSVGMIASLGEIEPGRQQVGGCAFFAGPQEEKMLEKLAPGLELVKDYGWLTILAKPLYWLLDKLHGCMNNWGWSIVALVCAAQDRLLLAQRQGVRQHGQDEGHQPQASWKCASA